MEVGWGCPRGDSYIPWHSLTVDHGPGPQAYTEEYFREDHKLGSVMKREAFDRKTGDMEYSIGLISLAEYRWLKESILSDRRWPVFR